MAMGYDADVVHMEKDSSPCEISQELVVRNFTGRGNYPSMDMDIDGIIDRLRQVHGAKNEAQLVQLLGLGKSAVSNWRFRNHVPADICFEIARDQGISMDWLVFGVGAMRRVTGEAGHVQFTPTMPAPSPAAERIAQFVGWWHMNRSRDEMAWLEIQFKRTLPEYGEWLVNPASVVRR
jgi:hypothetical protein